MAPKRKVAKTHDQEGPAPKKRPGQRAEKLQAVINDSENSAASRDPEIPDVTGSVLADTRIVRRWIESQKDAKLNLFEKYTPEAVPFRPWRAYIPITQTIIKLEEMPVAVAGRDFQVDKVQEFKTSSGRDSEVTSWAIYVNDRSNPRPQPFVLYKYGTLTSIVNKQRATHADGPIEKSFCPSKQDAEALGSVCCSLLNKLPCPLQEDKWETGTSFTYGPIYPRKMVEVLALDLWKPDFDYSQLHQSFIEGGKARKWFRLMPTQVSFIGSHGTDLTAISFGQTDIAWATSQARESQRLVLLVRFLEYLDFDAIERQVPDTPTTFFHAPTDFRTGEKSMKNLSQSQQNCIEKLMRWMCFETVGRVGTREQLQAHVAEIMRPLFKRAKKGHATKTNSGVFGGSLFFKLHRQADGSPIISPSKSLQAASSKRISSVTVPQSRLVAGHAMNAALQELKAGRNGLQAWHAMVLAVAAAEAGLDSQTDILQAQWDGITDDAQDTHIRACMLCNQVRHYEDLIPDDEGRLVCQLHHPEEFELLPPGYSSMFPVLIATTIQAIAAKSSQKSSWKPLKSLTIALSGSATSSTLVSTRSILQKEEKNGGFSMSVLEDAILNKLRESEIDSAKGTWQDAYNGKMDLSNAKYSGIVATKIDAMRVGTRPPHPDRPSMEAIYPFYYSSAEGRTFIHHPDNVTLTSFFFNNAKFYWPVSVLPLLRQAAIQANIEQKRMKTEAKTRVQVRDWSFWKEKHVQMEHIHRIASTVSSHRKTRLGAKVTQKSFEEYVKAWRTGVWSPNLPTIRRHLKYIPNTTADSVFPVHLEGKEGHTSIKRSLKAVQLSKSRLGALPPEKEYCKFWPEFTAEQKETYTRLIQEMHDDTEKFNPDNIDIRLSADGAPWPFPEEYYLDEEDDLWHWWYRFGLRCYWTMDDECDLENETQESPATIMLLFVERYFATGGGFDEFLHLPWVPWEIHPCKASIGRAGFVPPGSHMRTGWTKDDPDSLNDFDPKFRTVTVQCWVVNHLWLNWPTEMHPELLKRLMNIAESNQWYEKPSDGLQSMTDFYPKASMRSRGRSMRLRRAEQAEQDQVAEELEDFLDEDVEDVQDTPLPFDNVNDTIPGMADNEGGEAGEDAAPPPGADTGALGMAANEGGEAGEGAAPPPGADTGAPGQDLEATIERLQKQLQSLNDSVHKDFFEQAHSMEYSMLHQGLLDAVERGNVTGFAEQSAALQNFLQTGIMPAGAITATGTADQQDDLLSCVACGEKGDWTVMRACENNHGLVYWHVSCEEDGEGCPSCAAAVKENPDAGVYHDKDEILKMMAELKKQQESLKAAQTEAEKAHKRRQKQVRDQEAQAEKAHQRRQKETRDGEEEAQKAHQRRQKEAKQMHIRQKLSMLNLEFGQNNAQIGILRQQVGRYEERNTQIQTEIETLQREEAQMESTFERENQ